MSSGEDGHAPSRQKRQKRGNACDKCRKRKIKCNGRQLDTGKCTNCVTYSWDCTYSTSAGVVKYAHGYVEALQVKVRKLENLVKRLAPGQDFTLEVGYELTLENWMRPGALGRKDVPKNIIAEPKSPSMFVCAPSSANVSVPITSNTLGAISVEHAPPTTPMPDDEHSDDDGESHVRTKLQHLPNGAEIYCISNYMGKSSMHVLVNTVFAMCDKLSPNADINSIFRSKEAWGKPAWIDKYEAPSGRKPLQFPDPDLLAELVEKFFVNVNIFAPVLHRATFDAALVSDLHLWNRVFGGVVLLVCAIGSRFSDDRRVLADGDTAWHSAGWKWYIQAPVFNVARLDFPTSHLFELQVACLAAIYTLGISPFHSWIFAGVGIRIALDIGAHKRKAYGSLPILQDELYKRVFWTLVEIDRTVSVSLGRPCNIQEEDFDLEMPLCCDDEYLTHEDPSQVGKQPIDKPSIMAYFVWSLKLAQIQGLAQRTIYASTKARVHYNFQGEDWVKRTTAHLNSLLNSWSNSVPEHLRHDSVHTDDSFFAQSAHLYIQYHQLQIMIHRPFLSSAFPAPMPLLPLAICMNSARSLTRLAVALHMRRPGKTGVYQNRTGIYHWGTIQAGIMLLLGIGNARLHNVAFDCKQAMADVALLISILRKEGDRWRWAARTADLIEALQVIGEVGGGVPVRQHKRSHEEYGAVTEPPTQPVVSEPSILANNMDWDVSSIFGDSTYAGAESVSHDEIVAQSGSWAVLGNVDFGALFGFGDPAGFSDVRSYSPPPFGGAPSVGSGTGMDFGLDSWPSTGLDLGVSDWHWMAPPRQEVSGEETGNGVYFGPLR